MKNSRQVLISVAARFHVSPETLMGRSRFESATIPRYIAMKLMRDNMGYSLPRIGRIFGRKHSTVYSGLNSLQRTMHERPDIATAYAELNTKLFGGRPTEE